MLLSDVLIKLKKESCIREILYTALIGVLKISLYSPAGGYLWYFEFTYSSTQTIYLILFRYLFEGCYFGAIMGSAKIARKEW